MSSHFNYEIDERNLREKMKAMETEPKADAWARFEDFSNQHRSSHRTPRLPAIHLNINRTLVLPFVFGAVIILFSLLLFNFISINDKKLTDSAKSPILIKKTAPAETKAAPVVIQKKITKTDTLKPAPVPVSTASTIITTPTVQTIVTEVKTVPAATVAVEKPKTDNWTLVQDARIYASPNIASEVIGNSNRNQEYTAVEETSYFIKVAFTKHNSTSFGFIRKDALRKTGQEISKTPVRKQKNRKAETLESIKTPVSLSDKNSTEPELR